MSRKVLKGIDKMNMGFIIGLWGKVGKRVEKCLARKINKARLGEIVVNRGVQHVQRSVSI